MADAKLTALTSIVTLGDDDIAYFVDDPAGTPLSRKVTAAVLKTYMSASPTLVTPALGTPASGVATNLTGTAASLTAGNVTTNANLTGGVTSVGNAATVVTNANLTGHVTSVGNAAVLGSFTSLQLKTALTDETGSGAAVFATSPVLVTPALGTPASGVLSGCSGYPAATIQGVNFPAGTDMLFYQAAAPTGWTGSDALTDHGLRVVTTTGAGGGATAGTVNFTTAFASKAVTGTTDAGGTAATGAGGTGATGATTVSIATMPAHTHTIGYVAGTAASVAGSGDTDTTGTSGSTGGGGSHTHTGPSHTHTGPSHTHTFTGTAIDLAVKHATVIIAAKD